MSSIHHTSFTAGSLFIVGAGPTNWETLISILHFHNICDHPENTPFYELAFKHRKRDKRLAGGGRGECEGT